MQLIVQKVSFQIVSIFRLHFRIRSEVISSGCVSDVMSQILYTNVSMVCAGISGITSISIKSDVCVCLRMDVWVCVCVKIFLCVVETNRLYFGGIAIDRRMWVMGKLCMGKL